MGKITNDERVQQRRIAVTFDGEEIRELIEREARRVAGVDGGVAAASFRQSKDVGPSFRPVDWAAQVIITVELPA